MRMRRFSVVVLVALACVMPTTGCTRALRDGVSIGVTDGLSDGIAGLLIDYINTFSGNAA